MNYSTGFLFDESLKNVVLIQKTHPEWQKGLLNGVGGKIEKNESAEQAMVREFEEETGKKFTEWNSFSSISYPGTNLFFYSGKGTIQDVESKTEEEVGIYHVSNISNLETVSKLDWLVPMAKSSLKKDKFHFSGRINN